jgi:hypothetical protein
MDIPENEKEDRCTWRATIDRCFPLQDVPEAMRYLGAEHSKGKVMIVMSGR